MSKSLSPRTAGRLLAPIGLLIALLFLAWTGVAHAAFPGANGKIAFDRESVVVGTTKSLPRTAHGRQGSSRSNRGENEIDQIYSINPDSTGETNLSNNSEFDEDANWSADGLKISYDDDLIGDQIFSMNGDGSGQTNLTNNPDSAATSPAWSPDRTKIAFSQDDGNDSWGIWVMNADGSSPHEVIPPSGSGQDTFVFNGFPNWSPDGTKIAYSRQEIDIGATFSNTSQIYVANADGTGTPQNLSNNPDFDEDPNWSPNGAQLAFDKNDDPADPIAIWVMNADGSNPHQVTHPTDSNDVGAAWSPDGTQIAYESDPAEIIKGSERNQEIWVVNADGSNDHQVTSPPAGADDYLPDWQPVGSPASSASLASCTAIGSAVIHAADTSGFRSPLNVHYKVDGGAEQVAAVDSSGNATIALANGVHSFEYWAGDGAGYQEAAHHTATTTVDTVNKCVPPAPKVSVAGVRRACVSKAFSVRVRISSASKPKSVRVYLGSKRVLSTTKTSFTLRINTKKLGRHTRLRIVATDSSGKVTTISRTIARCAVAKPRRKAAPRFTG